VKAKGKRQKAKVGNLLLHSLLTFRRCLIFAARRDSAHGAKFCLLPFALCARLSPAKKNYHA
jgi:hypothetical protein